MAIRALARRAGCALRATRNRLCLDPSSRGIASGGGANSYLDSFGEGKNALITGAGKGIGRALVDSLAATGANVYAVSRTQSDLDEMTKQYSNVKGVLCDVGDVAAVRDVVGSLPPQDFVVNNAGISKLDAFLEVDPDDFDAIMGVNLRAAMLVSQLSASKMKDAGIRGSIVNVSSQASKVALDKHTSYCVSKAALDQLTQMMALELGKFGIRTNAVLPTVVLTDMGKMAWSDPVKAKPMLDRIPLGRFAEVDDVVKPIMFLLSEDASLINGALLPIEGGFLASMCVGEDE